VNWFLFYINCGLAMAAGFTFSSGFVTTCDEMVVWHPFDRAIKWAVVLVMMGIVITTWPFLLLCSIMRFKRRF